MLISNHQPSVNQLLSSITNHHQVYLTEINHEPSSSDNLPWETNLNVKIIYHCHLANPSVSMVSRQPASFPRREETIKIAITLVRWWLAHQLGPPWCGRPVTCFSARSTCQLAPPASTLPHVSTEPSWRIAAKALCVDCTCRTSAAS